MSDHQLNQEQADQRELERVFFLADCGVLSRQQAEAALMPIAARIWEREARKPVPAEEQPF